MSVEETAQQRGLPGATQQVPSSSLPTLRTAVPPEARGAFLQKSIACRHS
ncbi:MAG TPA: hypothetical protein VHF22_08960 [Planctomycetota bacterium]|nr:hypothetical protein [Planctomycetota bacterium]